MGAPELTEWEKKALEALAGCPDPVKFVEAVRKWVNNDPYVNYEKVDITKHMLSWLKDKS